MAMISAERALLAGSGCFTRTCQVRLSSEARPVDYAPRCPLGAQRVQIRRRVRLPRVGIDDENLIRQRIADRTHRRLRHGRCRGRRAVDIGRRGLIDSTGCDQIRELLTRPRVEATDGGTIDGVAFSRTGVAL